ncbi:MAG: aminotransferase class I/II-fold pyridoxal phosphate-dependent enzyme, partial [Pseudomonadota bacterium]
PETTLLILDEAYIDCAPRGTALALDTGNRNALRMRTFSKAYGMAGARVGYAIGHRDTVRAFEKVRDHFGMNRVSQIGALAALADQDYLAEVVAKIKKSRSQISEIAKENLLEALPSATNFVTIDCGKDAAFAGRTLAALADQGVFIRKPFAHPGDRCIRVSCGTEKDMNRLAAALSVALNKANQG